MTERLSDWFFDSNLGCVAGVLAIVGLTLLGLFLVVAPITKAGCDNRWADYPHRWEFIGGCLVQQPDGRWVPESVFRVVQR